MKIKPVIEKLGYVLEHGRYFLRSYFSKADTIDPVDINLYKGQALISFTYDDGQKNNFETALPLHAKFNVAAGFAVIAGRMQGSSFQRRYMEAWQVREASHRGIEIYSHSLTHKKLTEMPAVEMQRELQESRAVLRNNTGQEITSICIPFSAANEKVIATARLYYQHIRVHGRKFTQLQNDDQMIYAFGLRSDTSFDDVKSIIDKAIAEKSWVTIMMHGVVKGTKQPDNAYDVNAGLVEQILSYVHDIRRDRLLPVNFSDVEKIRRKMKVICR